MAQAPSFLIVNDSGAAVRAQLNQIVGAVVSTHAGPSAPPDTAPGMLWLDTSFAPPVLRVRNQSDTAFDDLLDGGSY